MRLLMFWNLFLKWTHPSTLISPSCQVSIYFGQLWTPGSSILVCIRYVFPKPTKTIWGGFNWGSTIHALRGWRFRLQRSDSAHRWRREQWPLQRPQQRPQQRPLQRPQQRPQQRTQQRHQRSATKAEPRESGLGRMTGQILRLVHSTNLGENSCRFMLFWGLVAGICPDGAKWMYRWWFLKHSRGENTSRWSSQVWW